MQRVCILGAMLPILVLVGLALLLGSCSQLSVQSKRSSLGPAEQKLLNNGLRVSAAAVEAGQLVAARRLYENLSRDFPRATEPRLGLAYLALGAGDFATAGVRFTEAGSLATTPALQAEALLGAGRASLGQEDLGQARSRLLAAAPLAEGTPLASWVANGLAVVASLENDYARAKQHYDQAITLSSSHPMITANLVRMLVKSGRLDEARQLHSSYRASYWLEDDETRLSQLIDNSGRNGRDSDDERNDSGVSP